MRGSEGGPLDFLSHLIMPLLAGSLVTLAMTARVTRASVIETFSADFVELLRAKGLRSVPGAAPRDQERRRRRC